MLQPLWQLSYSCIFYLPIFLFTLTRQNWQVDNNPLVRPGDNQCQSKWLLYIIMLRCKPKLLAVNLLGIWRARNQTIMQISNNKKRETGSVFFMTQLHNGLGPPIYYHYSLWSKNGFSHWYIRLLKISPTWRQVN